MSQATTIAGPEASESRAKNRQPGDGEQSRQLVRQPVRRWNPTEEIIREIDLSSDQLDRIQANESDYAASMQGARAIEQRTTIRLIRNLGRDPLDLEIVEDRRANLDVATLDRLRIAVDRVANLREILTLEQYRRLVQLDPRAVRIGSFQPLPVIQVRVTDPASPSSEETDP